MSRRNEHERELQPDDLHKLFGSDLSHEEKVKLLRSRSRGIKSLEDACNADAEFFTEEGKKLKATAILGAKSLITHLVHELSNVRNWDTDSDGVFNTFELLSKFEAILNSSDRHFRETIIQNQWNDRYVMNTHRGLEDTLLLSNMIEYSSFHKTYNQWFDKFDCLELISKSINKVLGPEEIAVDKSVLRETCRFGSELYEKIVNRFASDFGIKLWKLMGGK